MAKLTMTANELAARMGVEYATAAAVIKLMISQGVGKETGKRPQASGKGKPSTVYELDETFTISLSKTAAAA